MRPMSYLLMLWHIEEHGRHGGGLVCTISYVARMRRTCVIVSIGSRNRLVSIHQFVRDISWHSHMDNFITNIPNIVSCDEFDNYICKTTTTIPMVQ